MTIYFTFEAASYFPVQFHFHNPMSREFLIKFHKYFPFTEYIFLTVFGAYVYFYVSLGFG